MYLVRYQSRDTGLIFNFINADTPAAAVVAMMVFHQMDPVRTGDFDVIEVPQTTVPGVLNAISHHMERAK